MAPNIRIWWDESVQSYRVSTPYNKAFVEALKAIIPFSDRAWDEQTKIWTVSEKYQPVIQGLAEKHFNAKATVISKTQAQQAQQPPATTKTPIESVMVEFLRLLDHESALKAYRNMALKLHPDRGGDMTRMSALNVAWTRLEKDVFGKG